MLRGIQLLLASQVNARLHLLAATVVVALGAWLGISRLEWALLSAVIGLVLCAEALNTGIEIVVDLVSPDGTGWRATPGTWPRQPCCWPALARWQPAPGSSCRGC